MRGIMWIFDPGKLFVLDPMDLDHENNIAWDPMDPGSLKYGLSCV